MKQTWLLSCLGSLGKRKKNLEGKLNAMFSKEISNDSCKKREKPTEEEGQENKNVKRGTETAGKMVEGKMSKPSTGRVRKKLKKKEKKSMEIAKALKRDTSSVEEIYAKAKIDSKGDMSANVGKRYKT